MRNPFGFTPGGELIRAEEAARAPLDHDYVCPSCSQRLQLLGRHSKFRGFPRWEHHPYEAKNCKETT